MEKALNNCMEEFKTIVLEDETKISPEMYKRIMAIAEKTQECHFESQQLIYVLDFEEKALKAMIASPEDVIKAAEEIDKKTEEDPNYSPYFTVEKLESKAVPIDG